MNTYYGDFDLDATVVMTWGSYDGGTGASITQTGFVAADVIIFKDGAIAQKTSTNGITISNDFDGRTGLHLISIDTSNDTGDAGFWVTGVDFNVAVDAVTIDGQTVRFWVGSFSTENRSALRPTTAAQTLDVSAGGEAGVDWANVGGQSTSVDLSATTIFVCDTTTVNTDMRGTDSAALASVLGTPAGASIAADLVVIESQTDDIGVAGAGLTALPISDANVTQWNGAAVAVPTIAGVPEVDITHQVGTLVPVPNTAGIPDVNVLEILDISVSLTGGDLDVNVIGGVAPLGTAMRGTDSAALATVCTPARLGELDPANLPADIDNILTDTGTTLDTKINDIQGAGFITGDDSLEAIRNRGDAAWTTGAGGNDRFLLVDTTIATLSTQLVFTLTAGSADDDAYNNCTIVIEDVTTSVQKAVALVSAYVGATKEITLLYDPAIFVMAVTDKVYILAENALKATAFNRQLNVAADGDLVEVNTLTGHTVQTADHTAGIADIPTVSEFNARTILSASYFDPAADTVVNVTNVATLTGHVNQTGDSFIRLGAPAGASIAADLVVIESQTDDIGVAGAGLTALPISDANVTQWNGAAVAVPTVAGVPEVDLTHMEGVTTSVTDLKDFADAGYDPITNKITGCVLTDTVTANTDMRGTDSAALASVLGALADVASAGDPTAVDTVMQYIKQLINTLEGAVGIPLYPAAVDPGNDVSLAEAIRAIRDDVTGIAGAVMRGTDSAALASVLGTPAGASIAADLVVIESQTDDIGVAGAGLTAIPINDANVTQWNGAAIAVPTIAGVPEVDITHQVGTLVPTPNTAGVPDVNVQEILDTTVSLTTGDLDVNVASMATDTVNAAALATSAVDEIRDAVLPTQNVAFSDIYFLFVDSSNVPVTGATGTAVTRSIDGGAFGAGTGTIAEIGNGIYQYDASAADMNGGKIIFRFTATGGTPGAPDDSFVTIVTGGGV